MNNLELISVLEIAVFLLAIAQALTIALTIRRERDVKHLRELVEDQRLRLVELRAWLAGRNASQARRIASERETGPEPTARAEAALGAEAQNTEDAAARAAKTLEWQREVAARLQAGIKVEAPSIQQAAVPVDKERSSVVEDAFKWFKEDPNEPDEIAEARAVVAKLGRGHRQQAHETPENLPRTSSARDEFQRATEAVDRLNEDVEKTSSSLISRLNALQPRRG